MRVSAAEARRIALAAQGFDQPRPDGEPTGWDMRRVIDRVGLIQIDSVNVLERAHYMPAFSRLGPYDRGLLERAAYRSPRRLFEYWGHEASMVPVTTQPLLRWRMERAAQEAWGGMKRVSRQRPELLDELIEVVGERGPVAVSDLELDPPRRAGPWWDWSDTKRAMEFLFWSGRVSCARRRRFERMYDLSERVLPKEVIAAPTPSVEDAHRELLRIAARAHGIAAEIDLRDYFRLGAAEAKPRIAELVDEGELIEVEVEGWGRTAGYLWPGAKIPRRINARALVGPFDSLVWERSRNRRIFGFDFRLEIYVPAHKRVHGYYVLPFLLGDRLVARVDLKANRASKTLLARAIHLEDHAPPETLAELQVELETMAGWLGLDSVSRG
ncbi:winged helix-turn-helix domain-containing protein [soil metagenome]